MNKTFNCWEPLPSEAENYLTSCLNEKNFSDNAKELFAKRYYVPYFDTSTNEMNKEYCLNQLIKRVGRIIASGLIKEFNRQLNWFKMKSSEYDATCLKEKFLALMRIVEFNIRKDISLKRFLFNSPALFSSGVGLVEKEMSSRIIYDVKVEDMTFSNYEYLFKNKSPYQQMCACFVIDVDDNLDSIFDSVREAAIISKHGGGVGCNWSNLREKNAPIKDGSIGNSSGPVSFMELWNTMGKVVVQGGKRRSAIMSMMDIDHPDIREFIHAKEHDGSLQYFNISTRLDDEFLNAVKYEKPYYLKSRLGKDVNLADGIKRNMKLTQINASELFDEICSCAHKNGEPGIIFGDKINKDNLLKHLPDWQIRATNPCAEQPLSAYTSCNLGSINLESFIDQNESGNSFSDFDFICQIHRSILYLDCVVDANSYPLKKIEERTQDIRPLGLGFMGLANAAIKLKMGYGSNNFNQFCKYIGKLMAKHSMYASIDLCEVMEFTPFRYAKEAISHFNSELTFDDLPPSIKIIFDEQENKDEYRSKYLSLFLEGKLRNSRRLTIAPTGCSVKESYVVNNNGILRFDEIGVIDSKEQWNDLDNCHVIQENGIATATKFYINGHAQTKKITTFSNLELESTLNHKYRILADNGEYIWKEVSELKVGDKLVYKIGGYSKDSDPTLIFEEKDYHGNCRGIRIPSTLTPEFAKFIGIFTGNGSKHKQGLRISFNKNHNDKIQLTVDLIKSLFNISPVVLEDKRINTKDIYINSVILQDILLQLNLLKKSSREACIPKLIRQSSNLSILSFIEGLYMTDGSHNGNNKYIDTSSYQLAQELLIVLRAIGINGKIVIDKKRTGAKSKNYMYRIYFNTYGSENSEIKDRYISKIKKRDHESLKHISKDLYAEAIMEIIDSENDTYDIEVPKNNTYVLNSYISHNSISMLFDTSSGIEPNFAYQYDRRISKGHDVWETVQYTHPLYMSKEEYENQKTSKDDNYEDVYVKANDLSIEKHMQPLKILSKYIDSAISKTINLPSEATVEDVKNIYLDAFDSSIKGVTVYRDGSRGSQPIVDTTKKEEKKENIGTLVKDNEHIYTGKVRERSQFMRSITTKMAVEPYGSIYLTATLDENGNIFEIFSSIGKSGQMLKTMMEALSRIISIALRSGTNIQDVIGTLKFMSGTDRWIYDTFDKKEIEVNSIPDMLARMLEDIQKHFTGIGEKLETVESKHIEELKVHGDICPECGKELSHYDGCKICWSCQYSACK